MYMRQGVLVFILSLALSSPGQTNTSKTKSSTVIGMAALLQSELSKLDLGCPAKDVEKNLINGDRRLVGIYGFVLFCPGTDGLPDEKIHQYGIRPIHGTSDNISYGDHGRLIRVAIQYATQYNQVLIQRLQENE